MPGTPNTLPTVLEACDSCLPVLEARTQAWLRRRLEMPERGEDVPVLDADDVADGFLLTRDGTRRTRASAPPASAGGHTDTVSGGR